MISYPNAKINLGLNVVEKRPDGYHNIETIFYPIPLQDALQVKTAEHHSSFKMEGNQLDCAPDDNLVVRVLRMVERQFEIPAVDVLLYKHIPSGAGLGGGSSDAAFMLKTLNEKFNLGLSVEEMQKMVADLGADCAFFVENKPVYATGIGNVFTPIELSLNGYYLVLVKPNVHVSTRMAYAAIKPMPSKRLLTEIIKEPVETWRETMTNDFEASVFPLFPELAATKDRLYELGATYASMSGSGSALFGLFKQPVEHIEEKFPNYFVRQRELTD